MRPSLFYFPERFVVPRLAVPRFGRRFAVAFLTLRREPPRPPLLVFAFALVLGLAADFVALFSAYIPRLTLFTTPLLRAAARI